VGLAPRAAGVNPARGHGGRAPVRVAAARLRANLSSKKPPTEDSMPAPIELHYWPTPNGWKVAIALEEMGLPYDVRPVNIGRGEQFAPEFLRISPNNRMPAIVDPEGPDGAPISVFESGAILLYLSRKSGLFHGTTERQRVAVEEWLTWQIGGVGPMAGQAHHFLNYAPAMQPPNDLPYAKNRYRDEVARLYGVLDRRLAANEYVAGDFYSIADMAIWPWAQGWKNQQQTLADKPHLARWLGLVGARPAVVRGKALREDLRSNVANDRQAQRILFERRA
jgi:GST-like protein